MSKKSGKNKKRLSMAGKIFVLIQALISVIFLIITASSEMLPAKYMLILALIIFLLLMVACGFHFTKGKGKTAGIIISILVSLTLCTMTYFMARVNSALDKMSGAEYKTDNMVVVVRKDDPAQTLEDAADYVFGTQKMVDQDNTKVMCEEIEKNIGTDLQIKEYNTPQEMAEALLGGEEIGAAVYNSAFTSLIEEFVEGYSDKIRVLYKYGIKKVLNIETEKNKEDKEEDEEDTKDTSFNVYVSGIDVSGPVSVTSRSDVNIILTVNTDTRHILLTTTPRDYYVPIPEISGGLPDKLTHAGLYGVDASMRTLEQLYNIDISYYARVNFTSLINIVDTLGGIDVYSEYSFSAGGYYFEAGMNHMDGNMALAFSRERYSFSDGDNQRGKNQEAVMTAIIDKALSPAIITQANRILTDVSDSVETDMTKEEISKYISMQLSDSSPWTIESQAATGYSDGSYHTCFSSGNEPLSVMFPDEASVAAVSEKIRQVIEEKK